MAKAKEMETTENTENTETSGKAARGTSFITQARNAFLEILGEYTSSGDVSTGTLDAYVELYENAPDIKGVALPLAVQLANAESKINELYERAEVINGKSYFSEEDSVLRVKLIAKRDKIQKAIDAENDAENDTDS